MSVTRFLKTFLVKNSIMSGDIIGKWLYVLDSCFGHCFANAVIVDTTHREITKYPQSTHKQDTVVSTQSVQSVLLVTWLCALA